MYYIKFFNVIILSIITFSSVISYAQVSEPDYQLPVLQFPLDQQLPMDFGGIFVYDVDGDANFDYIITSQDFIGVYNHTGKKLWVKEVPIKLFHYIHHPSVIAGDLDGDNEAELAFLIETSKANEIQILDARSGKKEKIIPVKGFPIAIAIANLRGKGDRDILLQYDRTTISAFAADDEILLWETKDYLSIEHSPLRQADIDGDGMDEVAGANFVDHDGTTMNNWDLGGAWRNIDSMVIADIIPGYPLEVALAEQRGEHSHTVVVNPDMIVFRSLNPWNWEDPDKLAVGNFHPDPGLEIFNRSSGGDGTCPRKSEEPYRFEEGPWLLDSTGELICKYYINDKKPSWWTGHGIEEICRIDWDGDRYDEIVAKERHTQGAGAIIDPVSGLFRVIFLGKSVRIYAADVTGDFREEVVIIDMEGIVKVYKNKDTLRYPEKPSYWTKQHYCRQKQNWDYYSP
ncbi:hypothetical protein ACFL1R_01540 [Candidatus Latescibacterota bacterium]